MRRIRAAVSRWFWVVLLRLAQWFEFRSNRHSDYWLGVNALRWHRYKMALWCFSDAERAYEMSVGPGHGYTLRATAGRADAYGGLGELANAAELYERVLDQLRMAGRENHPFGRDIRERLDQVNQRRIRGDMSAHAD